MIAVRLMGGLGNQLFQYAFGRQLSHRRGVPLKLDLRWYDAVEPGSTRREFELGRYPIKGTIARADELPSIPTTRLSRALSRVVRRRGLRVYSWGGLGFHPPAMRVRPPTLLVGFWQSERYFPDVVDALRSELTPSSPPDGPNAEYEGAIRASNSVSLHVRRGDYVTNPTTHRFHGVAGLEYYARAMALVRERVPSPRFFVFSDDLAWCRDNLPVGKDAVFVAGNDGPKAFEDLRLMSRCSHHVIANSSFSWWGAWLNPSPNKVVVAPSRWLADQEEVPHGLFPRGWYVI